MPLTTLNLLFIFVALFLFFFIMGIVSGNPSKDDSLLTSYGTLQKRRHFYLGSRFPRQYFQWAKFGETSNWQEGHVAIATDPPRLLIYSLVEIHKQPIEILASFHASEICGFWQPKPYDGNEAEIHIDVNREDSLYILKLRMEELTLQAFVDALRAIATDEQILAFQRSRAYVSHELHHVQQVRQQLTGEWLVIAENKLYFTPSYLLIIDQHGLIENSIETETIRDIEALPRLDDSETGILRFWAGEQLYCFAMPEHELWANDLALAASKAQEQSVQAEILELKKKKRDDL